MKEKALAIVEALKEAYPDPMCALQYEHDYQLLIVCRVGVSQGHSFSLDPLDRCVYQRFEEFIINIIWFFEICF